MERRNPIGQLLLIMMLLSGSLGLRPKMEPNLEELIINEGDPLELTCRSSSKMIFVYPQTDIDGNNIITSNFTSSEAEYHMQDYSYIHEFRRSETITGDTGWYGCAEADVGLPDKYGEDPRFAWIYVYVKSDTQLLVQESNFFFMRIRGGFDAIIPCRPTSPDINVTIKLAAEDEIHHELQSTFDPRVGFKLVKPVVRDSNTYYCSARNKEGVETDLAIDVSVLMGAIIEHLSISPVIPSYIVRGQDVSVNCTATITRSDAYSVKWYRLVGNKYVYINDSRRIQTNYKLQKRTNTITCTTELRIMNSMDEDNGEYYCIATTGANNNKTAETVIQIHDPQHKFLSLDSEIQEKMHITNQGDTVQWIVHIYAHPPPVITWTHSLGNQYPVTIYESSNPHILSRYTILTDPELTSTTLFKEQLILRDSGNFTVEVSNEYGTESITFTLLVRMMPINGIKKPKPYYAPNEEIVIRNQVESYPAANIDWSYRNCPNYPSLVGSYTEDLLDWTMVEESPIQLETSVKFRVKMSGIVTCKSCNELGCDSKNEIIFVSDGNDQGFGIIDPKNTDMTVGDDVEIICTASIYNYTNEFKWRHDDEILETNERVKVTLESTQFTHRSILSITNLTMSDKGEYTCFGKSKDGREDMYYYNLKLSDPVAATITENNLNGSKANFDLNVVGHKTIILTCLVTGMPKPNITWYKDNSEIKKNDQYFFTRYHQQLNIKFLVHNDSGKYTCRTENRFGTDEKFIVFEIKAPLPRREMSKYWIIAVVVLLILCCILTIYFCIKMRRERIMRKELMEAGLMHFEEGALECLNPELTLDDQAELLPYDRKWEFPRERLILGKQLGSGAFGVVRKAQARGILDGEEITTVAVKMVRRTTDPTYIRALASELKIMVHLGKHLNVVNLLGACTKNISKRELLVIVEYCHYGNLHNYLLRHRGDFINQIDPITGKLDINIGSEILSKASNYESKNRIKYAALSFSVSLSPNSENTRPGTESVTYSQDSHGDNRTMTTGDFSMSNDSCQPDWRTNYRGDYKDKNLRPICTQDLISWAFQVARGMEYLSKRKVLHGDLAARNILLAENNVVKICDFGLAKTMYKDNNYKKKGDALLPIKWMAIESIRDRVFSTQSDIWSFGIVLWEFFTLAQTPYHGIDAETQYHKLIEGYRMEHPDYATKEVYDIMLKCWKAKPTLRPSFSDLVDKIGELLEESVKMHYVDLNTPYVDMNTTNLEGKNDYLTMMTAPDHTLLSSPTHDYVNSPSLPSVGHGDSAYLSMCPSGQDDLIFSPRHDFNHTHFQFPSPTDNKSSNNSDSEDMESDPMLKEEDDPYLKPINIHAQRARFVKERQSMREKPIKKPDSNLSYCNAPKFQGVDEKVDDSDEEKSDGKFVPSPLKLVPSIIKTQDNYVNMPKQKSDLRRDVPDGFSNPSYIFMDKKDDEAQV